MDSMDSLMALDLKNRLQDGFGLTLRATVVFNYSTIDALADFLATQFGGDVGESEGLKGILMMLAFVNVFFGVFNMFPLLPFDGGHVAIATYERIRSRRGKQYHADASKMVPVAVAVTVLMAMLFLTGSYLDIVKPL